MRKITQFEVVPLAEVLFKVGLAGLVGDEVVVRVPPWVKPPASSDPTQMKKAYAEHARIRNLRARNPHVRHRHVTQAHAGKRSY